MKTTKFLAAGLLLCFVCHAQEVVQFPLSFFSSTATNEVYQATLVDLPPLDGTFYSVQLTNQPPFPRNPFPTLDVYSFENIFLYDDRKVDYVALREKEATKSLAISNEHGTVAMADGPAPPGAGGGGTNGWPTNSSPPAYANTNGLWVEIADATNSVLLTLHNTEEGQYYDILVKTNLNQTNWTVEATLTGPAGTNFFSSYVSKSGRSSLFFMLKAATMSRVATPFFDPAPGNYVGSPQVTFFDTTAGATIRYTTNGASPTTNDLVIASGAFLTVSNTTQLKAKAWKNGLLPSEVGTGDYTIYLASPAFYPGTGRYGAGQAISIDGVADGATIHYTTNGSDPTTNSPTIVNGGTITLTNTIRLKAKAWKGSQESGVSSAVYRVPTAPANDNITNAQVITGILGAIYGTSFGATLEDGENFCPLSPDNWSASSVWYQWTAPTNGTVIFDASSSSFENYLGVYTGTDWSNCGENLILVSNDFTSRITFIAQTGIVYKISVSSPLYYYPQGSIRLSWTMENQVATPTFSPEGGTFNTNQIITVGCATANTIIHYSLSGNDPTESDPALIPGEELELNASYTLKAKAWKSGFTASAVKSSSYTISTNATNLTLVVSKPTFNPSSTNFGSNILITVSCVTTGATIYYTTNGFEPTTNDAVIASGSTVTMTNTQMLKAKAWKSGNNASGIQSGIYAKNNQDTDFDGIFDDWEMWHGSDIFSPDADKISSESFAHGLSNLQVFDNQSVLIADNYSTANDGIPDWWKVKNGMSINDPSGANIIGKNGLSALQSYNGGYDFLNANNRPGTLSKVQFKIVRGPQNQIYLKVDTLLPNITKYQLYFVVSYSFAPDLPASFADLKVNMTEFTPSEENPDNIFQVPPSLIFGHETIYYFGLKAIDQDGHISEENWPGTGFLRYVHEYDNAMVTNNMSLNEEKLQWQMRFRMAAPPSVLPYHKDFEDFGISYVYAPTEDDLWFQDDWNDPYFLDPMNPTWVDLGKFHGSFGGIGDIYDPTIYNLGIILTNFGLTKYTTNGQTFARMTSGKTNYHGLEYLGYTLQSLTNAAQVTVTPSADVNITSLQPNYRIFSNVEQPEFLPIEYYFGGSGLGVGDTGDANGRPPSSEISAEYTLGKTNPVLITSVNSSYFVDAWAKLEIYRPGSSIPVTNRFGYLQQYWDKAYLCGTNGDVPRTSVDNVGGKKKIDTTAASSMQTGILSPLGEFTPTKAGKVILTTKPDANGFYGECVVHVIDLKVDLNRDGTMDSADFTSDVRPFRFWANHDDDSGDTKGNDIDIPLSLVNGANQYYSGGLQPNSSGVGLPVVDGVRDLLDFFPVVFDIGSLVQALPPSSTVKYKLRHADDAVNVAYTGMLTNHFYDYLTNTTVASSIGQTQTLWITLSGANIRDSFLTNIPTQGRGVLLVEARKLTTQPLVLEVWDGVNLVGQTELHLKISRVEEMFRHVNLTGATGQTSGLGDRTALSLVPNEPETNEKDFVFLHGYNVNPESARGWNSEMFKRMFWSGSHAKFYGVTWRAYQGQQAGITPNLQTNIVNAFLTASNLAGFLGTLTNETIISGHSLGNMAILSALNDWNARIDKCFMIDAAVAIEAVQGNASQSANMYHPDWHDYATRLTASEWHNLFSTNDYRNTLTWRDRLANFQNAEVYNFYSSGEEVLRMHVGLPPDIAGFFIEELAGLFDDVPTGTYSWGLQEKMKGRLQGNAIFGSNHGGWGFNLNPPYYNFTNGQYVLMPNSQASLLPDSQLRTNAFFNQNMDGAVFGTNGSAYAQANRNRMIADAIPATTLPIGANPVPFLEALGRNFDMQAEYKNGWPPERIDDEARWHHSDVREVGYTYIHKLFDELVTIGDLK